MSKPLVRAPRAPVDVVIAPRPFTPHLELISVDEGLTLAQLLVRAVNSGALALADLHRTEIYIDGVQLVDRSALREIRPQPGEVVNIVVLPHGGGQGGRKNPLETALQLAVMVAAFAIAGPAGPLASALTNAGIAAGSFAASAIEVGAMASINLIGSVALSALFGAPSSQSNAPQYGLQNQTNQARQRQMMPLCLGARRWSFDVAATAFSTIVGNDVWLTVMYGVHYGPCALSLLKIGETLASAYPATELSIETFLTPGPRNSALYPSRIDQASLQNELDPYYADWSTETTGINATRIEIDLYWPQLIYTSSTGEQKNQDAVIYMQYSPYGANQWQAVPGYPAGTDADGNSYPAGSLWVQEKTENPTRRTVGWDVPLGQYDVRVGRRIRRGGPTTRSVDDVTWTALRTINSSEPAMGDENLSIVVIKAMASQDFAGALGVVSGVVTPLVPTFANGAWQGDPANFDATNWQPSSNAAALARYLLTGYPAAVPLAASQIDASLGEHFQTIEAMDWHGGQLVNADASQEDVLVKLGKLGRCYFYWNGSALCVSPDYEKPAPRQLFSGRNAKNYQYKRVFPDPIHAVYVSFCNADEDWKDDGLFVYNDGYTSANATLIEGLTLDYACTISRAQREGRVYLAKRVLLSETHQWTAGIDAIASTFGDRVAVRHVSTLFGIGEARVQFRRFSGALVAGVRLDTAVTFEAGQTYTIDVRRFDLVIRGLPLATTPGRTRDLVFAVPLAASNAPLKGDLVVVGQTGVVTEDVEIIDISPKPDGTADIIAQAYRADDIVAAETGPIAALQSALTARVAAPVPVILGVNATPSGALVAFDVVPQRQATIQGFTARWRRSPDEDATATWNTLPSLGPNSRTVVTPPFPDAQVISGSTVEPYDIDVEIRTVLTTGEISQPAQALNIIVTKGVLAPTNFAALGVVRNGQDGSSYPAIQISCDPLSAGSTQDLVVELQPSGSNPPAWKASASGPFHADLPQGDLTDVTGGQHYDVRARWRTADNWYSTYVEQDAVLAPSGLVSASTASVPGAAAIGTETPTTMDLALAALASAQAAVAQAQKDIADIESGDLSIPSLNAAVSAAQAAETAAQSAQAAANIAMGQAEGYANSAESEAGVATTAAGAAQGYATSASTQAQAAGSSATAAGQSAASAANSSQSASVTAAGLLPRDFQAYGQFFTTDFANPTGAPIPGTSFHTDTVGEVLSTSVTTTLSTIGFAKLTAEHTYEVRTTGQNLSGGTSVSRVGLGVFDGSKAYLAYFDLASGEFPSGAYGDLAGQFTTETILATSGLSTAVYVRPVAILDWGADATGQARGMTPIYCEALAITDVTQSVAAAGSAAAASTAESGAQAAQTAAQGYSASAQDAQTDAANSAAASGNSATASAGHAGDAQTAANQSASSASSAEGWAGQAQSYAGTAQAQAGFAQTFAGAASGSASAAQESASLVATYNPGTNMVSNPSFVLAGFGWNFSVAGYNFVPSGLSGSYLAYNPGAAGTLSVDYLAIAQQELSGWQAGAPVSVSGVIYSGCIGASTTYCRVAVIARDGSGTILQQWAAATNQAIDFTRYTAPNCQLPSATVTLELRLDLASSSGNLVVSGGDARFCKVKVENGAVCTPYTDDQVSAVVQENRTAVAQQGGKLLAWLTEAVAASGSAPAKFQLVSGDGTSLIGLVAQVLSLSNTLGNGGTIDVLTVANGFAYFASKVFVGSTIALDPSVPAFVVQTGSASLAIGGPFGPDGLLFWSGPKMDPSQMSKANGTIWFDSSGDAYFGGSLSAGTLTTKAGTSDTSSGANCETAVFGSNGHTITVTLSYSYNDSETAHFAPGQQSQYNQAISQVPNGSTDPNSGDFTASGSDPGGWSVALYRAVNGGAMSSSPVATLSGTGSWNVRGVPPDSGDPGSILYQDNAGGSLTFTDPDLSTETRQYQAVLTSRNPRYNGGISQRIGIICVEQ